MLYFEFWSWERDLNSITTTHVEHDTTARHSTPPRVVPYAARLVCDTLSRYVLAICVLASITIGISALLRQPFCCLAGCVPLSAVSTGQQLQLLTSYLQPVCFRGGLRYIVLFGD